MVTNCFVKKKRRLPANVKNYIKEAGYVNGFFPELMSHMADYTPGTVSTGANMLWNGGGKLALLSLLGAGGYYLYNKFKENRAKNKSDDDTYYKHIPEGVRTKQHKGRGSSVDYDRYDWGPDYADSDYDDSTYDTSDYDIPVAVTRPSRQEEMNKELDLINSLNGSDYGFEPKRASFNGNSIRKWFDR